VIEGLMKKGLVEERGRSNAVGRPILYGTTDLFLTNIDLTTIKELPLIEDIEEAIQYVPSVTAMDSRQTSIDLEHLESDGMAPDDAGTEDAAPDSAEPESEQPPDAEPAETAPDSAESESEQPTDAAPNETGLSDE
jgi:hypothetical protein